MRHRVTRGARRPQTLALVTRAAPSRKTNPLCSAWPADTQSALAAAVRVARGQGGGEGGGLKKRRDGGEEGKTRMIKEVEERKEDEDEEEGEWQGEKEKERKKEERKKENQWID